MNRNTACKCDRNGQSELSMENGSKPKETYVCSMAPIDEKVVRKRGHDRESAILIGSRLVDKPKIRVSRVKKLRHEVRTLVDEDWKSIRVRRTEVIEEHRSNADDDFEQMKKVYVMSGLSLYVPVDILHKQLSALVDCGAGINLKLP